MLIFVYGTLEGNSILRGEKVGKARTVEKYYNGENMFYPFLIHPENETENLEQLSLEYINGNVYEVLPHDIRVIDEYEGHPTFFRREEIEVYLSDRVQKVQCYFLINEKE